MQGEIYKERGNRVRAKEQNREGKEGRNGRKEEGDTSGLSPLAKNVGKFPVYLAFSN